MVLAVNHLATAPAEIQARRPTSGQVFSLGVILEMFQTGRDIKKLYGAT